MNVQTKLHLSIAQYTIDSVVYLSYLIIMSAISLLNNLTSPSI